MKKLLCGLLGFASISAFADVGDNGLNYQERGVYYSETDNVCHDEKGADADNVEILVSLNDNDGKILGFTTRGSTSCDGTKSHYYDKVSLGSVFTFITDDLKTKIKFNETTITAGSKALNTYRIVQKSTVANPVKISGNSYNCVIEGSGIVEHFSYEKPVKVALVCSKA